MAAQKCCNGVSAVRLRGVVTGLILLILAACGGGAGDSDSGSDGGTGAGVTPPSPPAPVHASRRRWRADKFQPSRL